MTQTDPLRTGTSLPGLLAEHTDTANQSSAEPARARGIPDPSTSGSSPLIHHHRIESHDGTELEMWTVRPRTSDDAVPVVLHASPYLGQPYAETPDRWDVYQDWPFPAGTLVENGTAVAYLSVRGTGTSGGCFEMMGPNEQADYPLVIEWLADQGWSNGNVGMIGLSYPGTTPLMAAIQDPPALETIVPAGIVSDLYTFSATPQGAKFAVAPSFSGEYEAAVSYAPPAGNAWSWTSGQGNPLAFLDRYAQAAPERICEDTLAFTQEELRGTPTDHRDPAFWDARNLLQDFDRITASVLLVHGLQDTGGHAFQDTHAWQALENAPKAQLAGQWGHEWPTDEHLDGSGLAGWNQTLVSWFDHWLKGNGTTPEFLGQALYEPQQGSWERSDRWPPLESGREALYLNGTLLEPDPGHQGAKLRPVGPPTGSLTLSGDCIRPTSHLAVSEPLDEPVTMAGNPFAYLHVSSDQPGGQLGMVLYDIEELVGTEACPATSSGNREMVTRGVADLRFHQGNLHGNDFPVNTPTPVRVDLYNAAHTFEEGHRIGVMFVDGLWSYDRFSQPYHPELTLHAGGSPATASHLVIPVSDGTLGGEMPDLIYPPRPFLQGMD